MYPEKDPSYTTKRYPKKGGKGMWMGRISTGLYTYSWYPDPIFFKIVFFSVRWIPNLQDTSNRTHGLRTQKKPEYLIALENLLNGLPW